MSTVVLIFWTSLWAAFLIMDGVHVCFLTHTDTQSLKKRMSTVVLIFWTSLWAAFLIMDSVHVCSLTHTDTQSDCT